MHARFKESCEGDAESQHRAPSCRYIRAVLVCVLALLFALGLSSCKYSDVLTEHIEDPDLGVVDPDVDPVYKNVPGAPIDPDRVNSIISESDRIDEEDLTLPHYDPDAPDNGFAAQKKHSAEAAEDDEASEGEEESGSTQATGQGQGQGDQRGDQSEINSDEPDEQRDPDEGGNGGETVIIDDSGQTSDEVARGTVAAVGEYATIAQMLAGKGGLVACDQAWLDSLPAGVFPGELDAVQVAWGGDGTSADSSAVDKLVNQIKPSVVLHDEATNVPYLTDEDKQRLEAAGIKIEPVATLGNASTEDASACQAVVQVAAVLSGISATSRQRDPEALRDYYLKLHHQALEFCYKANGDAYSYKATDSSNPHLYQNNTASYMDGFSGYVETRTTTVYIDDLWSPGVSSVSLVQEATTSDKGVIGPWGEPGGVTSTRTIPASGGIGLSTKTSVSGGYMLLDCYLQFSGIVNNAYSFGTPEPLGTPYLILPGRANGLGSSESFTARSDLGYALWYHSGDSQASANWRTLGGTGFPAVLVNGEATDSSGAPIDIAKAIYDASADGGLYHMGKQYQIIVVPSGVSGNWAYGNVESFLVAPWSLRLRSSQGLERAGEFAQAFYKEFYRCDDWSSAIRNWDTSYVGS